MGRVIGIFTRAYNFEVGRKSQPPHERFDKVIRIPSFGRSVIEA